MKKIKRILAVTIIAALVIPMTACNSLAQYKQAIDYLRGGDISELVSRVENALSNAEEIAGSVLHIDEVIREAQSGKGVSKPESDESDAESDASGTESAEAENNGAKGTGAVNRRIAMNGAVHAAIDGLEKISHVETDIEITLE